MTNQPANLADEGVALHDMNVVEAPATTEKNTRDAIRNCVDDRVAMPALFEKRSSFKAHLEKH